MIMKSSQPNSYTFQVRTTKREGSFQLTKLPLIHKEVEFNHQKVHLIQYLHEKEGDFYLTFESSNSGIYDVSVTCEGQVEGKENCFPSGNILTAQLDTYSYFLRSLDKNYRNGKISLILKFDASQVLCINIVLEDLAFQNADEFDSVTKLSSNIFAGTDSTVKPILQYLYSLKDDCVQYEESAPVIKKDVHDLYQYIKNHHTSQFRCYFNNQSKQEINKTSNIPNQIYPITDDNEVGNELQSTDLSCIYQHELLIPSLRTYQAEAIHWMIFKEKYNCYESENHTDLHSLWQEIICEDGNKIYFNPYNTGLSKRKPTSQVLPKGGILADEMGLGKTVEVLACILNNQAKEKFKLVLTDPKEKKRNVDNAIGYLKSPQNIIQGENVSSEGKKENISSDEVVTGIQNAPNCLHAAKRKSVTNNDEILVKKCKTLDVINLDKESTDFDIIKDVLSNLVDKCCEKNKRYIEDIEKGTIQSSDSGVDNGGLKSCNRQPPKCIENILGAENTHKDSYDDLYFCKCFVCGDLPKGINNHNKVKCTECTNVMHQRCTGYMKLNVSSYQCPTCAMKEMIDTHCTLIVCPDTLLSQWVDEVQKHVKIEKFKFMVYRGIKNHQFLQPKMLAEYDLIITSFGTLRLDFYYFMADQASRKLRYQKKYAALPCPLLALRFWRMCIDEAQMVESDSTKVAEMALRITAVHRWCVTGTPVQKTVEDVYGLLLFLCVRPYSCKVWWKRALLDHFYAGDHEPFFKLMSKVMWRTCKVDVEEQICLPKQTEYLTWLQFSAVEHHFYAKQASKCAESTKYHLNKDFSYLSDSLQLKDLSKQTLSKLLSPLLQLRQACCHPAVVRNSHLSSEKKCVTMEQLLGKLTSNAKVEAAEAHRKLLCSLNALAGIEILQENYVKAVEIYNSVIASWEEHNDLTTDSLQKLHTLHNLHDILYEYMDSRNSDDTDKIKNDAESFRSKYLTDINGAVHNNKNSLEQLNDDVTECQDQVDFKNPWWLNLIVFCVQNSFKDDLSYRLNDELSAVKGLSNVNIRGKFKTLDGFQLIFNQQLEKIEEYRTSVFENLNVISTFPSKLAVQETAECCLRPVEQSEAPRCCYCNAEDVINNYEKVLFSQQGYNTFESDSTASGLRSETELDRVLKTFLSFAKNYGCPQNIVRQGKEHIKYQEMLKKEFKCIRSMYISCHHRVQALDELDMCTMRLRFPFECEEDIESKPYVVKKHELHSAQLTYESDKIIARNELKMKQSQLLYLQNLAKIQTEHDGFNPETCPICVSQFGAEWAVFKCGHCICCKCVVQLQSRSFVYVRNNKASLRCPICRAITSSNDVSFVVTKLKKPEGFDAGVSIKGGYSTKIEAVLRRIKWIHEQDSRNKILVFSKWMDVLQHIGSALRENEILYKVLDGSAKHFQTSLSSFKESVDINVLLMLLHTGARGLNIIEATHVILVEPALNPGDELQAVGRVHRIGQTKATYVHRFVIKGTVEERMYSLLKTRTQIERNINTGLTVGDLTSLFT